MFNDKQNRRDFLKSFLLLTAGLLSLPFKNLFSFFRKENKSVAGKEAKYFRQADHLAG